MKKKIALLGSTGSIGTQALKVIAAHPDLFEVTALAAGNNYQLLLTQIKKFKPRAVSIISPEAARFIKNKTGKNKNLKIFCGQKGLEKIATLKEVELVLVGIPGIIALPPTIEALNHKKDVALASKEVLVAAGELVIKLARKRGVQLLPVDSEHSAIFQCLKNETPQKIKRLILTASGGPFWKKKLADFKKITAGEALKHPVWSMGQKVTLDSATLMNKGLEVIEAHYLFGVPYEKIEVLIHPESIIHSLVEFIDGSCLAQLATPDMTLPIQYAFGYPQRLPRSGQPLVLEKLTFFKPDPKKFPGLKIAYEAGKKGVTYPVVLNAANEVAGTYFLKGALPFLKISTIIQKVLEKHRPTPGQNLNEILEADAWARQETHQLLARHVL
jgi:1-deoxy-D-xylulose-5-phosphate reductoisomerase